MSPEDFAAMLALAGAAAYTPGPNNALVAASGARFGLRRSLPHILGITFGFPAMILIIGLFLGQLFQESAVLRSALRWGGAAVLLWIAWQIASRGGVGSAARGPRPFTFLEAAGFQWLNPKGWTMSIAITSQFVRPEAPWSSALTVAATFIFMGITSATLWALAGRELMRWLGEGIRLRVFNIAMGALVAATVLLLFLDRG